jgi:hypothetical protein
MKSFAFVRSLGPTSAGLVLALAGAVLGCGPRERFARGPSLGGGDDNDAGSRSGGTTGTGGATQGATGADGGSVEGARAHPDAGGDATAGAPSTGTWTAVKRAYLSTSPDGSPAQPGTAQLLTDGRVLASGTENNKTWFTFTPDAFGSYENGTWARVGSAAVGRLFGPGFILPDGRYWLGGGEYMNGTPTRAENEIYDPTTDTWTVLPDMPEDIGDSAAAVLGDGRLLVISRQSTRTYLLSLDPLPSWSLTARWSRSVGDQESGSSILRDGSVMFGSRLFQLYFPDSGVWVDTAPPPGGAGALMQPFSDEIGAMLMLHDGRLLVLGANEKNGLFTPGGPGAWALAADTPEPYNHGDAPAIVEPDGRVLSVVTDDDSGSGYSAAVFYEYDPTFDTWTPLAPPFKLTNAERVILLALPNGQIWISGPGSPTAWLYTPAGTAQRAHKPAIGGFDVALESFGYFALTGTTLNGTTTGGDFGDDAKMATNFPVVSFSDAAGHVYYGRSADFDTMTPTQCTSAKVVPPRSIPDGTYDVHVSASGVGEDRPAQVTFAGPRVASVTTPGASAPGLPTWGAVTLTSPAPSGGTTVMLSTNHPEVATVRPSVKVAAGATTAGFEIDGGAAGGSTAITAATTNSPAFSASTTIGWSIASVSRAPGASMAASTAWTVQLDKVAPAGGIVVDLASSNADLVSVPAHVIVPEGRGGAGFTATLRDPLAGSGRIYASLPGSSQSGPFGWYVVALAGPDSTPLGGTVTWTVSLDSVAPEGGLAVQLSSGNTNAATVPASVVVPAGQSAVTFPVNAIGDPLSGTATLMARFNASFVTGSFQCLVTPALSPATIPVGGTATVTLKVTPRAPASGLTIALQSSDASVARLPSSVTIAANAASATFPVTGVGAGQANVVMALGTWTATQTVVVARP